MDWRHAIERNGLAQIIALLFSLAFIAERAAAQSPGSRRYLIDILRQGEASGVRLVTRWGARPFAAGWSFSGEGYGPDDALRLAVSLRALGMALACQAQFEETPGGAFPAPPAAFRPRHPNGAKFSGWLVTPALIDTS